MKWILFFRLVGILIEIHVCCHFQTSAGVHLALLSDFLNGQDAIVDRRLGYAGNLLFLESSFNFFRRKNRK